MTQLSTIICTRDRAWFLGRTLAAIGALDLAEIADLELVVVDTGSRDHTPAVAEAFANVGERARARAAARAAKLRQLWMHEVAPRATVPESIRLLLDDELNPENHQQIAQYLQRFSFHITATAQP